MKKLFFKNCHLFEHPSRSIVWKLWTLFWQGGGSIIKTAGNAFFVHKEVHRITLKINVLKLEFLIFSSFFQVIRSWINAGPDSAGSVHQKKVKRWKIYAFISNISWSYYSEENDWNIYFKLQLTHVKLLARSHINYPLMKKIALKRY